MAYHAAALRLKEKFYLCELHHVKRSQNSQADALAKLASALSLPPEGEVEIVVKDRRLFPSTINPQNGMTIYEVHQVEGEEITVSEEPDWRLPLIQKLSMGTVSEDRADRIRLLQREKLYRMVGDLLYKVEPEADGMMLFRCIFAKEARKVMKEVHAGLCGAH